MNPVHVVILNNISRYVGDVVADFGQSKIEQFVAVIIKNPIGTFFADVVGSNTFGGSMHRSVEIEPSVKFHATLMTFRNHKGHGVVERLGCFALFAR